MGVSQLDVLSGSGVCSASCETELLISCSPQSCTAHVMSDVPLSCLPRVNARSERWVSFPAAAKQATEV